THARIMPLLPHRIAGFGLGSFTALLILVVVSITLNPAPPGLIGALPLMILVGALFCEIGDRTPLVRSYLGGGPIVVIFGSAVLATYLPGLEPTSRSIATFMKGGGFLDFYVASLITGSLLGMS